MGSIRPILWEITCKDFVSLPAHYQQAQTRQPVHSLRHFKSYIYTSGFYIQTPSQSPVIRCGRRLCMLLFPFLHYPARRAPCRETTRTNGWFYGKVYSYRLFYTQQILDNSSNYREHRWSTKVLTANPHRSFGFPQSKIYSPSGIIFNKLKTSKALFRKWRV